MTEKVKVGVLVAQNSTLAIWTLAHTEMDQDSAQIRAKTIGYLVVIIMIEKSKVNFKVKSLL